MFDSVKPFQTPNFGQYSDGGTCPPQRCITLPTRGAVWASMPKVWVKSMVFANTALEKTGVKLGIQFHAHNILQK